MKWVNYSIFLSSYPTDLSASSIASMALSILQLALIYYVLQSLQYLSVLLSIIYLKASSMFTPSRALVYRKPILC